MIKPLWRKRSTWADHHLTIIYYFSAILLPVFTFVFTYLFYCILNIVKSNAIIAIIAFKRNINIGTDTDTAVCIGVFHCMAGMAAFFKCRFNPNPNLYLFLMRNFQQVCLVIINQVCKKCKNASLVRLRWG